MNKSDISVGDLQIQISKETGHAYIIDPMISGISLNTNPKLAMVVHALEEMLSITNRTDDPN